MTPADWADVRAFARTHRGVDACLWPLIKLVRSCPTCVAELDERQQQLIRARLLNQADWHEVVLASGVSGRAEAVSGLREAIAELLVRLEP